MLSRDKPAASQQGRHIWQQVAALRAAGIVYQDLGLASVMVDEQGRVWLVDSDRAEAAASDRLLDRDLATLLAALEGVADPALVQASAEQTLSPDTMGRILPRAASTQRGRIRRPSTRARLAGRPSARAPRQSLPSMRQPSRSPRHGLC